MATLDQLKESGTERVAKIRARIAKSRAKLKAGGSPARKAAIRVQIQKDKTRIASVRALFKKKAAQRLNETGATGPKAGATPAAVGATPVGGNVRLQQSFATIAPAAATPVRTVTGAERFRPPHGVLHDSAGYISPMHHHPPIHHVHHPRGRMSRILPAGWRRHRR